MNDYIDYYDTLLKCRNITYNDSEGNNKIIYTKKFLEPIKYSKGPSIEKRSKEIWRIIKPYLRNMKSSIDSSPYKISPIQHWAVKDFQVKNIANPIRMGIKNIFSPIDDSESVRTEVEKHNNSIVIIFDDNISGGATLSDIYYQLTQLGFKYVIPITFGKMDEKQSLGIVPLRVTEWNYDN